MIYSLDIGVYWRFTMTNKITKLQRLKKEKDAVILAHYYVNDDIQEIADYVGDSYYLSEIATKVKNQTIVLCGVSFMGESAKILSPEKTVLLPDEDADCPMAHMAEIERIEEVRKKYKDVAVVCYVNSTAELKTHSDVCVTSSNALKIVQKLPNKYIFFIPDENLGSYIAKKCPDKHFILNDGYCHVHTNITKEAVENIKIVKPDAEVLVHPECKKDVIALADYTGSTSGIIDYVSTSTGKEFIIGTEIGVLYELQKKNPDKKFYTAGNVQVCPNMKKITLDKIINALDTGTATVTLDKKIIEEAYVPLRRMMELAK